MDCREELNRLGGQWHDLPGEGNEAARLALREKIFVLAYQLFPGQRDAMGLFFEKDWDRFDPGRGELYGFMSCRLKMRMIDLGRRDTCGGDSLDAPVGGEGAALGDTIPGDAGVDDSALMIDERVLELMTLMLDLKDRLGGRAGNPVRINYFRLFFTDGVVDAIHSQGTRAFARRERDLFRAVKVTFLNYIMGGPCGSVEDILAAGLKPYGQMVEGRPMEPPGQPLPNDVYTTYLARVEHYAATAPAVSRQRTAYRTFMRERLLC